MNLRFIQNIIMTGLSDSFIANTDSVLCILCIFCGSTLSLSRILLSFCFHIIIIATVQRKFYVYLLPILLQLVDVAGAKRLASVYISVRQFD